MSNRSRSQKVMLVTAAIAIGLCITGASHRRVQLAEQPNAIGEGLNPCVNVDRWEKMTFKNDGQFAYTAHITSICASRKWYRACYVNSKGEYSKTSGYVEPYATKPVYLPLSGSGTPTSFRLNEASELSALPYPYPCTI
jgi:hypothetical protein